MIDLLLTIIKLLLELAGNSFMDTLVQLFTIVASICSAIGIFIGIRTLREVKVQRETTYRPEIIIEGQKFFMYRYYGENYDLISEFSSTDKGSNYKATNRHLFAQLFIVLHNIGLGAATEIYIKFEIDLYGFINQFNKYTGFFDENNKIIIDDSNEFLLHINYHNRYRTSISKRHNAFYINHLISINNSTNSQFNLQLPPHINEIYLAYINCFWSSKPKNSNVNLPEFPVIYMKIKYKDIAGKTYFKDFKFKIDFKGGHRDSSICQIEVIYDFLTPKESRTFLDKIKNYFTTYKTLNP